MGGRVAIVSSDYRIPNTEVKTSRAEAAERERQLGG